MTLDASSGFDEAVLDFACTLATQGVRRGFELRLDRGDVREMKSESSRSTVWSLSPLHVSDLAKVPLTFETVAGRCSIVEMDDSPPNLASEVERLRNRLKALESSGASAFNAWRTSSDVIGAMHVLREVVGAEFVDGQRVKTR